MILGFDVAFLRFGAVLALPLVLICPSFVYFVKVAWIARSMRRNQDSSAGVANVTGYTRITCTTCTTDTMDVVIYIMRYIIVVYMSDALNIDAARCNIG